MKRKIFILTLTVLITAGAASFALATSPAGADASAPTTQTQQPDDRCGRHREKNHLAMAALLGLSDKQQSQIQSIIATARQTNLPLRQKLANDREKIRELSEATPFDETAVRALIAGDEAVRTDLTVSRIKMRNQIQAILTPDQQAKAKQMRLLMHDNQRGYGKRGI